MTRAGILRIVVDLLNEADNVRADYPESAAIIEARADELLASVAGLSVAEVAELLGQSRPTIYEWVKAGYLVAQDAAAKGMSISPRSLMILIPILDQWEEEGRQGRPSRLLAEWFAGAAKAREQEEDFAARRRAGLVKLNLPRRSGTQLAATV